MYRKSKSINLKKIYIRFTYFMFYLVKVSPIACVTSIGNKCLLSQEKYGALGREEQLFYKIYKRGH